MVIHTQRKVCKIEIKDLKEQFNIPEDYSPISLKKELKGLDKTSVLFKNGKDGTYEITSDDIRQYLYTQDLDEDWKIVQLDLISEDVIRVIVELKNTF